MRTLAMLALLGFVCALSADTEYPRSNPNTTAPKPDSMVIKLYSNGKLDTVIVLPRFQGLPIDKLPQLLQSPMSSWQFDSDNQSLQDLFRQAEKQYKFAEQMYQYAERLFESALKLFERYQLSTEDNVFPPPLPDQYLPPPPPPPQNISPPDPEQFRQHTQRWLEKLQLYQRYLEDVARNYYLDSAQTQWNGIPRTHKNMLDAFERAIEQLSTALENVEAFSKQYYEMLEAIRPKLEQLLDQIKKLQPKRKK